jgi:hypothetical protein
MLPGQLFFKDGSSLTGSYEIIRIRPGANRLIFLSWDIQHPALTKDADLLKSMDGKILIKGLDQEKVSYSGKTQTIMCRYVSQRAS